MPSQKIVKIIVPVPVTEHAVNKHVQEFNARGCAVQAMTLYQRPDGGAQFFFLIDDPDNRYAAMDDRP